MSEPTSAGDLRTRVANVLAVEVIPALRLDGVETEVLEVRDGVARVRMGGLCATCPGTVMAIFRGVEQELCRLVPEVEYLEVVP